MVDIPDKDLLAPGHRGCAGCGASIAVKLALNALGENTVAISATESDYIYIIFSLNS